MIRRLMLVLVLASTVCRIFISFSNSCFSTASNSDISICSSVKCEINRVARSKDLCSCSHICLTDERFPRHFLFFRMVFFSSPAGDCIFLQNIHRYLTMFIAQWYKGDVPFNIRNCCEHSEQLLNFKGACLHGK